MFKFGFSSSDNNETEKHTLEAQEKDEKAQSWLKSEEVLIGNNEVCPELLESDNNMVNVIELEDKCIIRHVSTIIVAELIRSKKDNDNSIFKADQNHSDLITAVYEGGLKIWQCTYDLLDFIYKLELDFQGKKVLDLGCGAGILGLFAYINGAHVYFQDYNPEVLKFITIPNALLNNQEVEKPTKCRFYSGDWQSFLETTEEDFHSEESLFDYILTSETIYNCDNYVKLNDVFKKRLKKTGTIYLAAKTFYFGVGGGIRCFEDMIKADDVFTFEHSWKQPEGVQREIIALKYKPISKEE